MTVYRSKKDSATVAAGFRIRLHCTIFTLFLISLISRTGWGKLILALRLVLTCSFCKGNRDFHYILDYFYLVLPILELLRVLSHSCTEAEALKSIQSLCSFTHLFSSLILRSIYGMQAILLRLDICISVNVEFPIF